jgi:hypothetical protein
MPDPVNQPWLRFPDGSICSPWDPSLCLHAHLLNNGVAAIQHTDLHTWSLTASGLLQLDGTSECFDAKHGTKASIINCEFTNSSFVFGSTLNFAPLVDLASIISIYNYSTSQSRFEDGVFVWQVRAFAHYARPSWSRAGA